MNNTFYGTLIFELSKKGRKGYSLPANEFKQYSIPAEISRQSPTMLPVLTRASIRSAHAP